ncbi:CatB-related O-acetyltransferase [Pedobacter nototheniae]|uniref:CatB-related O-acetyltransferase n=1 Tax=Pedobacter nototheniae TaxID=2488994 RepID=UPI001FEC8E8B|nr:CatB-related O-acetyltransferase [Pedobacter nototheniae]
MIKKTIKSILSKFNISISRISNLEIKGTLRIHENVIIDNCEFGDNISLGRNSYLFNTCIGNFSYISQNVSMMNTKAGKFVSIAQNVLIGGGMHPSKKFVSTSPVFYSLNKQCGTTFSDDNYFREMGNTLIGNDVWIGANAVIMDDLIIGDGAIIGAGAIVTKNVEPYSIVAGVPAKHINYRFDEVEVNFLLNFKWWDKSEEWLKENYKNLHDIKEFIKKQSN